MKTQPCDGSRPLALAIVWCAGAVLCSTVYSKAAHASTGIPFGSQLSALQGVPADSRIWWPLTDDISAAEIRAALLDDERSRERYREASAADDSFVYYVSSDGEESRVPADVIRFYLNPGRTPKLVPMYLALEMFAFVVRERGGANGLQKMGFKEPQEIWKILQDHQQSSKVEEEGALVRREEVYRTVKEALDRMPKRRRGIANASIMVGLNAGSPGVIVSMMEIERKEAEALLEEWRSIYVSPRVSERTINVRKELLDRTGQWESLRRRLLKDTEWMLASSVLTSNLH